MQAAFQIDDLHINIRRGLHSIGELIMQEPLLLNLMGSSITEWPL